MTVSRAELEACLERLRREARDPRAGLFGPGSWLWRVNCEAAVFLGSGCAALLQAAHPYVAQGVADHSSTTVDTAGRFLRTFDNVFSMVFGDLDHALSSARRVHAIHTKITGALDEALGPFPKGARYEANDEAALFWVAATLTHTSVQVYELAVRPLARWEKDAYYADARRFALLFGLSERAVPPDWAAFERYMAAMFAPGSPIVVGRAAREIGRFLVEPQHTALVPAWRVLRVATAALLPERLRAAYALPLSRADRALFRATLATLRRAVRAAPPSLRYLPGYNDALVRLGAAGSPLARAMAQAWEALAGSARASPRRRPATARARTCG